MATNATAKSRDPRIGQDSADLTLGALFLVDNRPKRTRGTSPRNFSNWVIAEHLKRHSYYRHEKEERKLITAGKMRSRIAEIWKKNATAEIKFSDDKREDIVDVLFGMTAAPNKKGSALLKKEYLKKLGYDKETFVESLLNKHDSEEAAVSVEVGGDGSDDEGGKAEAEVDKTEEDHDHSESDEASVDEPSQPQSTLRSRAGQSSTPLRTSSGDQAALKLTLRSKARNFRSKSASADEHGPRAIDEMSQLTSGVYSQTTALATQDAISGASDSTSTEDTLSRDDATTPAAKRKHDAIESSHEVHSGDEQAVFLPEPENKRRRTEEDIVEVRASDEPQSSNVGTPDAEKQKDQTDPESIVETPVKPHGNGGPDTQQKKQREPPLAELNFDEQGRNLEELSRGCKEAINTLLTSIGQIRDEQSPLHPDATGPLEALYARCWGPDWRDVRARLRGKYVFIIPQVTTSLLAAFLYDNVLSQEASPQEIRENFLRLRGTTSKAMLSMFDENAVSRAARNIAIDEACATLARPKKSLQQELQTQALAYTKCLWTAMQPHFEGLQAHARLQGLAAPETDLHEVFEMEIAPVIQKMLHYRLKLLATDCEYAFTWPSPEVNFEPKEMRSGGGQAGGVGDQGDVLFTVFPGLKVKTPDMGELETLLKTKALVKVERIESEPDAAGDE